MIGLGSNRLTVCRRGGMSVTQAGRGGMEWLAGNGKRRESPYSAQATAALKAQFPTQWATIRDYGFAHPALVPFINEDPMLVMSLIEGLGTRWLMGDGNSWIATSTKNSLDMQVEVKVNNIQYTDILEAFVGCDDENKPAGVIEMRFSDTIQALTKNYYIRKTFNTFTTPHVLLNDVTNNKFYFDGVEDGTKGSVDYSSGANIMLFKITGRSTLKCWESYCKITIGGSLVLNMVPFVSTTRNGMLDIHDLENPVFYPNAGTGTFTTSETPAS